MNLSYMKNSMIKACILHYQKENSGQGNCGKTTNPENCKDLTVKTFRNAYIAQMYQTWKEGEWDIE